MQQYLSSMTTQIPDDIARLAHEQQLGSPQAGLSVNKLGKGWRWIRFLIPISLLLACALFLTLFLQIGSSYTDFTRFFSYFSFVMVICYLVLIVSSILSRNADKSCTLYPCDKGFILRLALNKFRVVRWDEVETIWQTPTRSLTTLYMPGMVYALRLHDGEMLTFRALVSKKKPNAANVKNMVETIEEYFTSRRLPFQFADYQAGQTLSFGAIGVNREGISLQDRLLTWEQVANLSLRKNCLIITKTGEKPEVWASLAALKISNLSILLALFKRIRGGQSEQEEGLQALATYGAVTTVVTAARKIDPLPAELAALAEECRLGERRVDQMLGRKRGFIWPVLIVLPSICLLYGGMMVSMAVSMLTDPYTFDSGWSRFSLPIILLAVIILISLLCLHIFLQSARQLPRATYIFERGLISRYGKQAPVVCQWEEIAHTEHISFLKPDLARVHIGYRLQKHDGSALTLFHMNINLLNLSTLIKEQIVPLQIPSMIGAFQQGQTLDFGKIQVNQQGITLGTRQLPWSSIKSIRQEMNRVVIYDIIHNKPQCKLPVVRVPDLFLLFALADYARDISGPKEPL